MAGPEVIDTMSLLTDSVIKPYEEIRYSLATLAPAVRLLDLKM